MTAIYQSFEPDASDSAEDRRRKLYLGIISVGEQLYCVGSQVAEIQKTLNSFETDIRKMRQEFEAIRRQS